MARTFVRHPGRIQERLACSGKIAGSS
jgi:hypothetical protein